MENSKIEWTDHTFNPWWGCMKVSEGCKNCYAETLDNRYHKANPHWGPNSSRKPQSDAYWKQPIKWNFEAEKAGKPARVFCASMADVFEGHPDTYQHLERLIKIIDSTPWLTWQLLTKRPENITTIVSLVAPNWAYNWPANVITGTSVENQAAADKRIPQLLQVPGKHFLSMEPLLGPVNLQSVVIPNVGMPYHYLNVLAGNAKSRLFNERGRTTGEFMETDDFGKVHWVIVGGESGPKARPMHPDWASSIQKQCAAAGVPFFFKQWGEYAVKDKSNYFTNFQNWVNHAGIWMRGGKCIDIGGNILERGGDFMVARDTNTFPVYVMHKLGKHAAGRLLDGKEYNEIPEVNTKH